MTGIKEFKEFLSFTLQMISTGDLIFADGVQPTDFIALGALLPAAVTGISGVGSIPAEIADIDQQEADELKEMVMEKFDIRNDMTERIAEEIMKEALDLFIAVKRISNLIKEGKEEGDDGRVKATNPVR